MDKVKWFFKENGWIWAVIGSVLLWLIMGISSGRLNLESFLANAYVAAFLGVMAFAQMMVVTSGRGAIDLSIPGVITLAAFTSMVIVNGSNARVPLAVGAVIVLGILIGVLNALMVIYLRIPAMIATMAMNYILTTAALLFNKNFPILQTAEILNQFTRVRILGVQLMIYIILIVTVLIWFLMARTPFGKSLAAVGQNRESAKLSGISIVKIEMLAYVFSSVLAALGGFLIAARAGNAILGMGDTYQLECIAAVVIGGTLMSGGKARVVGTLAGCLFLNLIVTNMQIMGFGSGAQNIVKGALIIIVFIIGTSTEKA